MTSNTHDRLRAVDAAKCLCVSRSTLAKWRMKDVGPRYHHCGPRIVYYLRHEIDAWLAECDRSVRTPKTKPR